MYTKQMLVQQLKDSGIRETDTLLVHSSIRSMGEVEGRADGILDALAETMKEGLLVLPTHTWAILSKKQPVFDVLLSPSCVGTLPEVFRWREGVIRSLHPTHSVAALGKEAAAFTAGEEYTRTPFSSSGVYGRLMERDARILHIGCTLTTCTTIHCIEEYMNYAGIYKNPPVDMWVVTREGCRLLVPQLPPALAGSWNRFDRIIPRLENAGALIHTRFGDAKALIVQASLMKEVVIEALREDPDFFGAKDAPKG